MFVCLFDRTMTAICFVCNLPILSHQVGLVWSGGNGWDDMVREQLEESTLRQRLGGRRDSSAQVCCVSPPTDSSPPRPGTYLQAYTMKVILGTNRVPSVRPGVFEGH